MVGGVKVTLPKGAPTPARNAPPPKKAPRNPDLPPLAKKVAHPRLELAQAALEGRDIDLALQHFAVVVHDDGLPPLLRATAASRAVGATLEARPLEARYWCLKAQVIDDQSVPARWALTQVQIRSGGLTEGLRLARALVADHPETPLAWALLATALTHDAQPAEAIRAAQEALDRLPPTDHAAQAQALNLIAYGHSMLGQSGEALAALQDSLRRHPTEPRTHAIIADYLVPDFSDRRRRAQVTPKLAAINHAYQAGDLERVWRLAAEVVRIDPNDGLGHSILSIVDEQRIASRRPLVEVLATTRQRTALIQQLEKVCARATVGQRPGRPSDLFPDWKILTELQRATVAASILGFGKLVPLLLKSGAKYRLPPPGTSVIDRKIDPAYDPKDEPALGRRSYAMRGLARPTDRFVVTGVERLELAARGEYNTVGHELLHLLHFAFEDLEQRALRQPYQRPLLAELAKVPGQIRRLYREAVARRNDQRPLDGYSAVDEYEFFAQGAMSYLALSDDGPMQASKLEARNPRLWRLVSRLVTLLSDFPEEATPPDPQRRTPRYSLEEILRRKNGDGPQGQKAKEAWVQIEAAIADRTTPWRTRRARIQDALAKTG